MNSSVSVNFILSFAKYVLEHKKKTCTNSKAHLKQVKAFFTRHNNNLRVEQSYPTPSHDFHPLLSFFFFKINIQKHNFGIFLH